MFGLYIANMRDVVSRSQNMSEDQRGQANVKTMPWVYVLFLPRTCHLEFARCGLREVTNK